MRRAVAICAGSPSPLCRGADQRPDQPAAQAARAWRQAHESAILGEFSSLLALPNLARDNEAIRKNAAAVSALLEKRGVKTRYLEVPGAPPVVFGEIPGGQRARTIIFYAHYDGQPLDPKEWATPPWEPVIRDGRIYARSASDDKAPIIAIATALDALQAAKLPIRSNIKFVFEGEEEAGSPHLGADHRKVQGPAGQRRLADLRWSGAPEPPPADRLRRARHHHDRHHPLRPQSRTAQRPLRQLGAQPRDGPGAPARRHEGRRRPRPRSITSTTASSR